jgi:uncharacterized protein YndB with AHSA1/START domain
MIDADCVRVSTRVAVDPETAFRLFTEDVDVWWRGGPRFRWHGERDGTVCFEPGVGGRFLEVYDLGAGDVFEVGRIQVWDPPHRLVFTFRARAFEPDESTEVEVRFVAAGEATDVTVEHRGWDALRADHPVRHGMDVSAFSNMMGVWWADLLTSARHAAAARGARAGA